MDLRQLRYFVALAEELNFTRAARRSNVSQPPFSRAIRDLEEELGARLFNRNKHHVALTAAGDTLLADARNILLKVKESAERTRRTAQGLVGTLTFGFGGSTAYSLLPALVRHFRETYPDVELRFRAMSVLGQIEALRGGEIDIGIVRLPIFDELIETRFVYAEPLVAALPSDHPLLADSCPISIDALRSSPFVTYEPTRGYEVHADLIALCRLAGFDPVIRHQAPTTEAVVGIVACGEGVAIVPASAERLRMRGVAFLPLESPNGSPGLVTVRFALAWRREQPSATTLSFADTTAELMAMEHDKTQKNGANRQARRSA